MGLLKTPKGTIATNGGLSLDALLISHGRAGARAVETARRATTTQGVRVAGILRLNGRVAAKPLLELEAERQNLTIIDPVAQPPNPLLMDRLNPRW